MAEYKIYDTKEVNDKLVPGDNTIKYLYQWDAEIKIAITGDFSAFLDQFKPDPSQSETTWEVASGNLATIIALYSNRISSKAYRIGVDAAGKKEGVYYIIAKIPNELLMQPETIKIYVGTAYDSNDDVSSLEGFRTWIGAAIPVIARAKPEDYVYTELSGLAFVTKSILDTIEANASAGKNASDSLSNYATITQLNGKQDTISDLSAIRTGASKGDTALQPGALNNYVTTGDLDEALSHVTVDAYTKEQTDTLLADKQDTISDLSTIRSGAQAGATAVQPGALTSKEDTANKLQSDPGISDQSNDAQYPSAKAVYEYVNNHAADNSEIDRLKKYNDDANFALWYYGALNNGGSKIVNTPDALGNKNEDHIIIPKSLPHGLSVVDVSVAVNSASSLRSVCGLCTSDPGELPDGTMVSDISNIIVAVRATGQGSSYPSFAAHGDWSRTTHLWVNNKTDGVAVRFDTLDVTLSNGAKISLIGEDGTINIASLGSSATFASKIDSNAKNISQNNQYIKDILGIDYIYDLNNMSSSSGILFHPNARIDMQTSNSDGGSEIGKTLVDTWLTPSSDKDPSQQTRSDKEFNCAVIDCDPGDIFLFTGSTSNASAYNIATFITEDGEVTGQLFLGGSGGILTAHQRVDVGHTINTLDGTASTREVIKALRYGAYTDYDFVGSSTPSTYTLPPVTSVNNGIVARPRGTYRLYHLYNGTPRSPYRCTALKALLQAPPNTNRVVIQGYNSANSLIPLIAYKLSDYPPMPGLSNWFGTQTEYDSLVNKSTFTNYHILAEG